MKENIFTFTLHKKLYATLSTMDDIQLKNLLKCYYEKFEKYTLLFKILIQF